MERRIDDNMKSVKRPTNFGIIELRNVEASSDLPSEYVSGLSACIESAFGGGITDEDALDHMRGDQVLIGISNNSTQSQVAGFSATTIETVENKGEVEHPSLVYPCAYFAAAAITKVHQGRGLYSLLNDKRLEFVENEGVDRLYTRTQNPRVEQGISRALDRMVEARRIKSFTIARYALIGVYGGMLTDAKPLARTVSYDNLDYERGDENIVSWQLFT